MGYISKNPNPCGLKVGDCVVRALSLALGRSWRSVYLELTAYGFRMCDMPSSNAVWDAMLRDHGFRRGTIDLPCVECYTIRDFCDDHPEGVYVVGTGSHAVAVVDGNYLDAWDSGNEIPLYYYQGG